MDTIKSFKGYGKINEIAMDTIKSFKGYGKINEIADKQFRRTTRRRLVLIAASAIILLLLLVIIAVAATAAANRGGPPSQSSIADSIKAMCNVTLYPTSCFSSISSADGANSSRDPEELFKISLAVAMDAIAAVSAAAAEFDTPANDRRLTDALRDCHELFDSAIDRFNDSLALMRPATPDAPLLTAAKIDDLVAWLSAAVTDQETCLDGFEGTTGEFRETMEATMENAVEYTSNSLAIAAGILGVLERLNLPLHRKLLSLPDSHLPEWVSVEQRRVLQEAAVGRRANVTVAADGSGQVRRIKEAIDLVPKKSEEVFLIYVKEGVYKENVVVDKNMWNVMIFGDGMYKTVVDGKLNFVDGTPTLSTATFTASGRGFTAMDMGFKNSAGPEKHQAVALRSSSDRSVFFRCSFDGFQDTLYAHSLRQFFRDCDIAGTIDFIFGDAAAVFQTCTLRPRQPLPNQQNTITAHGKKDPNQATGFAVQACTIRPFDANVNAPTYLGRPWKNFSTTVIMQSEIGAVVDPAGWLPWVIGTEPPSTITYAEYQNTGPGSSVSERVKWAGYRPEISAEEASKFTVESFIKGGDWIRASGVQFQSSLGQ